MVDEHDERQEAQPDESGHPRGGKGRRDVVGRSGVYPLSSSEGASEDAKLHGEESWGQGERGAAGYEDHGESEILTWGEIAPEQAPEGPEDDTVVG